jgi:hypothetical protein
MYLESQRYEKSEVVAENDCPVRQHVSCFCVPLTWLISYTVSAGLNLVCYENSVLPDRNKEPQ